MQDSKLITTSLIENIAERVRIFTEHDGADQILDLVVVFRKRLHIDKIRGLRAVHTSNDHVSRRKQPFRRFMEFFGEWVRPHYIFTTTHRAR